MKYLLDTCVVSDFVKGEIGTLTKIKSLKPSELSISAITLMEIQYGLLLNPARAKSISKIINDFLAVILILDFNRKDADHSADIRTQLKQAGCLIGGYDILIAGTALNHQLTLVSANTKEFNLVKGLQLENWRQHT